MTARGRFSAGFDNSAASGLRFPRQLGHFAAQGSVKQILQAGVREKPLIWWADGPECLWKWVTANSEGYRLGRYTPSPPTPTR